MVFGSYWRHSPLVTTLCVPYCGQKLTQSPVLTMMTSGRSSHCRLAATCESWQIRLRTSPVLLRLAKQANAIAVAFGADPFLGLRVAIGDVFVAAMKAFESGLFVHAIILPQQASSFCSPAPPEPSWWRLFRPV